MKEAWERKKKVEKEVNVRVGGTGREEGDGGRMSEERRGREAKRLSTSLRRQSPSSGSS